MNDDTTQPRPIKPGPSKKRILFAVGTLLFACAVGIIAAEFIKNRVVVRANIPQQIVVATPKSAIALITAQHSVPALSGKSYMAVSTALAPVAYKDSAHKYTVTKDVTDAVIFTSHDQQSDDRKDVADQIGAIMEDNGLAKASALTKETASTIYTLYAAQSVTCQLSSTYLNASSAHTMTHAFGCADKPALQAIYTEVDRLIGMIADTDTNAKDKLSQVRLDTNQSDGVSYTIVTNTAAEDISQLLFATINGQTEFIADLAKGDVKYDTGKYIITPETKAKLSDPKYKGVLLQHIAGQKA